MRHIKTFAKDARKAIVFYHADWDQYFVRFFLYDKAQNKMTYPADDRQDAMDRADYFINLPPLENPYG